MAQNVNATGIAAIVRVKFVCARERASEKNVQRLKHELKQRPIASSFLPFGLSLTSAMHSTTSLTVQFAPSPHPLLHRLTLFNF